MDLLYVTIPLTITAATLLFGLLTLKIGLWKKKRYHPVAGTIYHQVPNLHRLHDYHTELACKYKNFKLVGDHSQVYITDPACIEYFLKTNFQNYGKGSYHYNRLRDFVGDGIFTVDGAKWRRQRKLASHEFSTRNLKDFSSLVFEQNAAKLAHKIAEIASSNQEMDIQELFMKSTMDAMVKIAFGIDLDILYGSKQEGNIFSKACDDANALTFLRYFDVFWKVKRVLNIGSESELKRSIKVLDKLVYKLIQTKREQISSQQAPKEDILSRFIVASHNDPENMNDQYLRDVILSFMLAGKDTTAITLSWFLYMLCEHTNVQDKVAQEVKQVTEDNGRTAISDFAERLNDEALNKMKYLHAAISETLRLHPAVPLNSKVCLCDDTLPDGHDVRRGDVVAYAPYAMGRMKYIWGDDAEFFRPERWIDEQGNFRLESSFKFTAFQAGPRICLGKEFAYIQMKIFAAVLLRFFTFKLSDTNKPVKYKTMLTLHIDNGLHLRAFPRQK